MTKGWLDEDLDLFAQEVADEVEEKVEQTAAERKAHLEKVKARGGTLGQIASELLVAAAEREALAERDRLAAASDLDLVDGDEDWDSPAFLEGLRAQVLAKRVVDEEAYLRDRESAFVKEYGREAAVDYMNSERAALATVSDFEGGGDPLLSHPAYLQRERSEIEAARALAFARDRSATSWSALQAEGEADLAATFAGLVEASE